MPAMAAAPLFDRIITTEPFPPRSAKAVDLAQVPNAVAIPNPEEAFERAVDEVAAASKRLLDSLVTSAAPKDRAVAAARARARAAKRYAAA